MVNPRKAKSLRQQRPDSMTPMDALKKATRGKPVELRLDEIDTRAELQPRVRLDRRKVEEYQIMVEEGSEPPPIEVFRTGDGDYLMSDGFHRYEVFRLLGRETILAYVHEGGWIEARLHAEDTNLKHGLAFSNADKRKILEDRIRYGYGGFVREGDQIVEKPSTRELAKDFGVSHRTIGLWIEEYIRRGEETGKDFPVDPASVATAPTVGADGRTRRAPRTKSKKPAAGRRRKKAAPPALLDEILELTAEWRTTADDHLEQGDEYNRGVAEAMQHAAEQLQALLQRYQDKS